MLMMLKQTENKNFLFRFLVLLNIIIKEQGEFGVAFKLYFLHSSTITGSACVRVWIPEKKYNTRKNKWKYVGPPKL